VADASRRGPHRRGWAISLAALVLAGIVAGVTLWATGASGDTGFRLGVVSTATVRQTLGVSGTADPVNQGTAAFQVAGTVSGVNVAVGQQVTAGQTLASLDPTTLTQNVSSAQSTLTAAQAKLAEDESGQSSTTSASSSSGSGTSTANSTTSNAATTALVTTTAFVIAASTGPTLAQAQQAVVAAQQAADADAATAAVAFAQAQSACAGTGPTTSTTTTSSTTTTTPTTDPAACTNALSRSLAAQQQVATDQKAVATAEATLAQVLASTSGSGGAGGSGATNSSGSTSGTGSGSSGTSGSTGRTSTGTSGGSSAGGSGDSSTNSAQQLATDQASIDSATASLIEAQQSLADAQLTSPLTGTVASVDLAVGQAVTAGSASDAITIINSGSYQATASLTSTQAAEVKVGDQALVTVNGINGTLTGSVTRVGPVDASDSSYTYPLIVLLTGGSHGIAAGSTAQVQVVLHQVADTRAVPTSAVHTVGHSSYVFVPASGGEARKKIAVGIVGSVYTQVTGGITKGATVVLASLSEAVPSSSTSSSTSGFGGAGFGGGGIGGGGFGGAGGGGGRFSGRAVGGA
jgi:multidrug efflux pump subunit AcrA (membrane-fusion protein)